MTIFKNLIGHRINGVFLANEDWTLIFRTCEGKYFRYDTDNDCCNSVWVNHISGINCLGNSTNSFDLLQGALVTCAEDKGWGENRDDADYDVVQDGFWTISTDKGYILTSRLEIVIMAIMVVNSMKHIPQKNYIQMSSKIQDKLQRISK